MIEQLAEMLKWRNDSVVRDVELTAVDWAAAGIGAALADAARADGDDATAFVDGLQKLPLTGVARLTTAPQLHQQLHSEAGVTTQFLADSIDAELRVAGMAPRAERAVWTAVGDWYFPIDANASDARAGADPFEFSIDEVHMAPLLANGVPVDLVSPFRRGKLTDVSGDDAAMSPGERRQVVDRIDAAVFALDAACPGAAGFVARLSRIVVPRKDHGSGRHFRSTSTRMCPGRPVLRNVDVDEATTAEIVDGLVHETIHCAIDLIELGEPLILDRSAKATTVESPWSGRRLDLDTYVQACFVWYGLWNMWLEAVGALVLDERDAVRSLARCERGFDASDITAPLDGLEAALAPSLLDQLRAMQDDVRTDAAAVKQALAMARS